MAKRESNFINMTVVLLVITAVASFGLASVYNVTKEPIEKAQKVKKEQAIKMVVPEFDNDINAEMYEVEGLEFYPAKKGGELVGTAIKTFTEKGFSGRIDLMVGLLPDGSIHDISVLDHKETPGLGTKMAEPKFKDQFKKKNAESYKLIVKKDGGDVDAITAATISSRAFCDGVQRAYDAYQKGGKK